MAQFWSGVDRRGSTVITELFDGGFDIPRAWRLSLSHRDPSDVSTIWTVSVVTIEELSTKVFVRLDRTRDGSQLRPTRDSPAPPSCIRAILEAADLQVLDGGRPLTSGVWVPSDEEAHAVAELVTSSARRLPVFGFTLRDDDVIDGSVVSRALAGLAHVVLIRSSLSWLMDDLLPAGMNVYGGAARLWWPGLTTQSNRWDHPLWTSEVSAHRITMNVVDSVVNAAIAHAGGDEQVARLERRKREIEHQDRENQLRRLKDEFNEAWTVVDASGAREDVNALSESITRLIEAERQERIRAETDRGIIETLATQVENELVEIRQRARAAESERDYWKAEFTSLNQSIPHTTQQDTALTNFHTEIVKEIKARGHIEGARPRKFSIGSKFMARIDALGQGSRNKTIKACADVITNASGLLSRRDDHSLRSGPGAGDPEIYRESDGAKARRCAIEQKVASARRIHYWVTQDGVI
jgi:hypothetical protein